MTDKTPPQPPGDNAALAGAINKALLEALRKVHNTICPPDVIKDGRHTSSHARYNLEGVYADLESLKADSVCLRTIDRVSNQLAQAEVTIERAIALAESAMADEPAQTRAQVIEECARVAENFPKRLLWMWERPSGPPGNGSVDVNGQAYIAAAIRALASKPEGE